MRRRLVLVLIGVVGGAALSLAVFARAAGAAGTRAAITASALRVEAFVWPVISRVALWIAPGPGREEREVWRVMIDFYGRGPRGRISPIGVAPESYWPPREKPDEVYRWIVDDGGAIPGSPDAAVAVQNLLFLSGHRVSLEDVALPRGSKFVTRDSMFRHADERLGWETDSGANGVDAWLALSRVGFNMRGNVAVVYVDCVCGPLCGHGTYYVLRKRGGKWIVGEDHWRWAS